MNRIHIGVIGGIILIGVLSVSQTAGSVSQLQPNLVALSATNVQLQQVNGTTFLRFSTTSWNNGAGPLELRAGEIVGENSQRVYQRIYNDDATFSDRQVGDFVWHPSHGHFHFEGYALYTLQPVDAPGESERTSQKTTFCVMDTTRMNTKLPGAPKRAVYNTCGTIFQGMSVGWGDTYGYQLAGQEIDVTGLPDGEYNLRIEIDPQNRLVESNESDNVSNVGIRLVNGTVEVVGGGHGPRR